MSFKLYLGGFLILIVGVAWGMIKAGISPPWVIISGIVLLGLGVLSGVSRTRSKDLSKDPDT